MKNKLESQSRSFVTHELLTRAGKRIANAKQWTGKLKWVNKLNSTACLPLHLPFTSYWGKLEKLNTKFINVKLHYSKFISNASYIIKLIHKQLPTNTYPLKKYSTLVRTAFRSKEVIHEITP